MKRAKSDKEKNGKARDLELFMRKSGIEKLDPEIFHYKLLDNILNVKCTILIKEIHGRITEIINPTTG